MIVSAPSFWLGLSVLMLLAESNWGDGAAAGADGGGAPSPVAMTLPLCGEAEVVDMVPRNDWCCDCYKESNVSTLSCVVNTIYWQRALTSDEYDPAMAYVHD